MNKKFLVGVIGATVLVLAAGVGLAAKMSGPAILSSSSSISGGKVEVAQTNYDFGTVPINGGKVERVYEVKNVGEEELKLSGMGTSCMCTTAQVVINGEKSPAFGMHDPSKWVGTVQPGETAEVVVIFDPAFHGPSGKGVINRIIKFTTSDPNKREVELSLNGKVI